MMGKYINMDYIIVVLVDSYINDLIQKIPNNEKCVNPIIILSDNITYSFIFELF